MKRAGLLPSQTRDISVYLFICCLIKLAFAADYPDYYYPDPNMYTDGSVRSLLFHNGMLYVGGNFREVTGSNGTFSRNDIAAFDVATGKVTGFEANTNFGTVRAIVAGGGRIFIGGSFTSVNDIPQSKVAALDPTSGEVLQSFRSNSGEIDGGNVWSLAFSSEVLYIGGSFTSVDQAPRSFLAALNGEDGSLIEHFKPDPGDPLNDSGRSPVGVLALEINPNNPEMVFVGGNFQTIGGANDRSFLAALYMDGTFGPKFQRPVRSPIIDIDIDGTFLCAGVGGFSNCVYTYNIGPDPFERYWRGMRVHGDVQAVACMPQGYTFFGFHDGLYDSIGDYYRLAIFDNKTGELYDAYPLMDSFLGVRSLDVGEGCLAAGGEFTIMSFLPQSHLAVFRKFPFSTIDTFSLEAPELLNPYNQKIGAPLPLFFEWFNVMGASSYELQVAENEDFSSLVMHTEGIIEDTCSGSGLENTREYWWRVRAKNIHTVSEWSEVKTFTTEPCDIDIPLFVSPADGAINQPQNMTFIWHPTLTAQSYRIEIAKDSRFRDELAEERGITDTVFTLDVDLANGTTYYWRICAETIGGRTDWRSGEFSTIIGAPNAPHCIAPSNNAIQIDLQPELLWERAIGATAYRVLVAADSQNNHIIVDSTGVTDTSFTLSGLKEDTRYFWSICASNIAGKAQTYAMKFTTKYPLPKTPDIYFPYGNYIAENDSIQLQWSGSAPYISRYWVEVATDSIMLRASIDSTVTDTGKLIRQLSDKTDFWWRVRAYNASGWSGFSKKRHFKTRFRKEWKPRYSLDRFQLGGGIGHITYNIAEKSSVEMALFDLTGKLRWRSSKPEREPGQYKEVLDITGLPTGRYFLSIKAGKFEKKAAAVLVR